VLESMKMHMELRTPRPGVVRSLRAAAGQEVAQGDVLAVIGGTHNEEKNGSDEADAGSVL